MKKRTLLAALVAAMTLGCLPWRMGTSRPRWVHLCRADR